MASSDGTSWAPRVLIVEDDVHARDALAQLLREEGFEVTTASDGVAALARLAESRFHLVLTDLQMPGMNGLELLRRLKQRQRSPKVIAMSARDGEAAEYQARSLGATALVRKPIVVDELVSMLRETCA